MIIIVILSVYERSKRFFSHWEKSVVNFLHYVVKL